jgi:hypothetical protein
MIRNLMEAIDVLCSYGEEKESKEENKNEIKKVRNFLKIRNINNDINNNNEIIKNIVGESNLTNVISTFLTSYMNTESTNINNQNNQNNINNDIFYDCENPLYFCECDEEIQKNRSECVICIENIKYFDRVIITKCKHVFHYDCITTWIRNMKTCPTCRTEI